MQYFSYQYKKVVFHRRVSDSMFFQVSRTLLSIWADLNNVVVCMVTILLLISNSFSLFFKLLETIPNTPIIINITNTFMFYSFFLALW